jgi:hypothetical protein
VVDLCAKVKTQKSIAVFSVGIGFVSENSKPDQYDGCTVERKGKVADE